MNPTLPVLALAALTLASPLLRAQEAESAARPGFPESVDVCIYGGTDAGIIAAVAVTREGRSVAVIEPGRWLGGMTGGGIGTTDFGDRRVLGGLTREFFFPKDGPYPEPLGPLQPGLAVKDRNWTCTQREHRERFLALVKKHRIPVLYEHRVARVEKDGLRLAAITVEKAPPDRFGCPTAAAVPGSERIIRARMFLDCSYEGDLMARAGVSYTWGREAAAQYGEGMAGVQLDGLVKVQLDPWVKPGDPASGLLPGVRDLSRFRKGDADKLSMGYSFRFKLIEDVFLKLPTDPANGIPIPPPPASYDPARYELAARAYEAGAQGSPPNIPISKDGNTQRKWLVTTSPYGANEHYPDGDYATRARIWREHFEWTLGLLHFCATSERVPESVREWMRRVRLDRSEFPDTEGWPHQLYVRIARRMLGRHVMTQQDCEGARPPVEDSIAMGSYGIDYFPTCWAWVDGHVITEGGNHGSGATPAPYGIAYRSITPRAEECENLLVPVCASASYIAMSSIRMEPVYMMLGESAGVAACQALAAQSTVQGLDVGALQTRLRELGQILTPPTHKMRARARDGFGLGTGLLLGLMLAPSIAGGLLPRPGGPSRPASGGQGAGTATGPGLHPHSRRGA